MKNLRRMLAVLVLLIVLYGAYYIYLGPRLVGDAFAFSLVNFDNTGMNNRLCTDYTVTDVLSSTVSVEDQSSLLFIRLLTGIAPQELVDTVGENLHPNTQYNPLTGEYRFSLTLGTDIAFLGFRFDSGFTTPEFRLGIRRGWLLPCVLSV